MVQAKGHGGSASLKQAFPCRDAVIDGLERLVCCSPEGSAPVLLSGPPSTGKTAITRAALREWGIRHAYIDCIATRSVRALLGSVVSQLKNGPRLSSESFAPCSPCDSPAELLQLLPSLFPASRRAGAGQCTATGPAWIVLDNVRCLAGSDLLPALARAGVEADVPLSLLLIDRRPWSSGAFLTPTAAIPPPRQLASQAYSADELIKVIERRLLARPAALPHLDDVGQVLHSFLIAFVPTYRRATCDLLEVEAGVNRLFPLYAAPLEAGRKLGPAQLHARVAAAVQRVVTERSAAAELDEAGGGVDARVAGCEAWPPSGGDGGGSQLPFQLPYVSKYLILAAFLASRNQATADRAVFDPGYRGKRAKRGGQTHDKMVEAGTEALLKGPHAFSLERLLHIFYALYSAHEGSAAGRSPDGQIDDVPPGASNRSPSGGWKRQSAWAGGGEDYPAEMLSADVLMALQSLVTLRMLGVAGPDVLDAGCLYRCNVEESVAYAVAANLQVQLSDYLKLA